MQTRFIYKKADDRPTVVARLKRVWPDLDTRALEWSARSNTARFDELLRALIKDDPVAFFRKAYPELAYPRLSGGKRRRSGKLCAEPSQLITLELKISVFEALLNVEYADDALWTEAGRELRIGPRHRMDLAYLCFRAIQKGYAQHFDKIVPRCGFYDDRGLTFESDNIVNLYERCKNDEEREQLLKMLQLRGRLVCHNDAKTYKPTYEYVKWLWQTSYTHKDALRMYYSNALFLCEHSPHALLETFRFYDSGFGSVWDPFKKWIDDTLRSLDPRIWPDFLRACDLSYEKAVGYLDCVIYYQPSDYIKDFDLYSVAKHLAPSYVTDKLLNTISRKFIRAKALRHTVCYMLLGHAIPRIESSHDDPTTSVYDPAFVSAHHACVKITECAFYLIQRYHESFEDSEIPEDLLVLARNMLMRYGTDALKEKHARFMKPTPGAHTKAAK